MGCCVSKCKPKKCYIEAVQDKIVIPSSIQPPPPPAQAPIPVSKKISPSPLSSTISSSSSSISSFTRSTINSATSSCSSVSSSASGLSSKLDRSFSNEYLWACVKENPHIVRINSIKEASRTLARAAKSPYRISNSPVKVPVAVPTTEKASTPLKRGRPSSPSTLTRQKSFRKDPPNHTLYNPAYSYLPSRTLRSPSPSRRFNGDNYSNYRGLLASTSKEIGSSRIVTPKMNALNSVSSSQRRENFRVSSPKPINSHDPSTTTTTTFPLKSCLRNRETFIHRISSKIDETALRAALSSQQENESISMEDIDNPHISLDCFIFL